MFNNSPKLKKVAQVTGVMIGAAVYGALLGFVIVKVKTSGAE